MTGDNATPPKKVTGVPKHHHQFPGSGENHPAHPTIVMDVRRGGTPSQEFSPLTPPRELAFQLHDVGPSLVGTLQNRVLTELEPGTPSIPLFPDLPLPLEIPTGCRCSTWFSAADEFSGQRVDTMITSAEMEFTPPLVLHNIVPILLKLHTLFQDNEVDALLARIYNQHYGKAVISRAERLRHGLRKHVKPRVSRLLPSEVRKSGLGRFLLKKGGDRISRHFQVEVDMEEVIGKLKESLKDGSERLARVELERVTAHPVLRDGTWQLDLRFSGRFLVLGRVPTPFTDVHVPHIILPYPHAALDRLASEQPMASAAIRKDRLDADEIAKVLASRITSLDGTVMATSHVASTLIRVLLGNQGWLRAEISPPEPLRLKTHFKASVARERISVRVPDLELRTGKETLKLDSDVVLSVASPRSSGKTAGPDSAASASVVDIVMDLLAGEPWPQELLALHSETRFHEGSSLSGLSLRLDYEHPLMRGATSIALDVPLLSFHGSTSLRYGPGAPRFPLETDLVFQGAFKVQEGSRIDTGSLSVSPQNLEGGYSGHLEARSSGSLDLALDADGQVLGTASLPLNAFPELDIEAGPLSLHLDGNVGLKLRALSVELRPGVFDVDFKGSSLDLDLGEARLEQGPRRLSLPSGSRLETSMPEGFLSSTGLGEAHFDVAWDLQGRSPVLEHEDKRLEIFVPELRQGSVTVGLSPAGGLSISGEEKGLYDAHYFNAMLNPHQELTRWMEILEDDTAMDHVHAVVQDFSPDLASLLETIRRKVRTAIEVSEEESINKPGDIIPGPKMARALSLFLTYGDELTPRIYKIIRKVTDGEGLDLRETRKLLDEVWPNHDFSYELDSALRWFALLLAPMEQLPARQVQHLPPLTELEEYRARYAHIPSAAQIYGSIASVEPGAQLPPETSHSIARVSAYLALEQIDYLLNTCPDGWAPRDRRRLDWTLALKRRVRMISESYGGFGFAPQAMAIGMFLGVAMELDDTFTEPNLLDERCPLPDLLMGPADIAVLLQAGLASPLQDRVVQQNQRMLLDHVLKQERGFLLQVMLELGQGGERVLASVLNALLELEQGLTREPLDLVSLFSERLGLELPRLRDYLAGGRHARLSYYEALNESATRILAMAEPYNCLKAWLQTYRHPAPSTVAAGALANGTGGSTLDNLRQEAILAIQEADRLGALCTFKYHEPTRRRQASTAYQAAFDACKAVLDEAPLAFQEPWFKDFWSRNYEALMVLTVLRNVQMDIDQVRPWLRVRLGYRIPSGEQGMLDSIIDALYYHEEDRKRLKADPLVRLLMDPPPGEYDFALVSCMGVVTEGSRGTELRDAYRRIARKRGIQVIRADTATARSLEYNAARVEDAVRQVERSTWGYLGYSQGCANGLMAECRLMGGTPEQQALLKGLRTRNFIYSSINGSAHGTAGDLKFLRAMIMGDHILAHYQARLSDTAIQLGLKALRLALDSRPFLHTLHGVQSLSHQGVLDMGRNGQFKVSAPTCGMRGIVSEDILPEALEFLSHVLEKQIGTHEHDTQVEVHEAVGYPVWVRNAQVDAFKDAYMGCAVQHTHHWSPLLKATEFITTRRDLERCIYQSSKDSHVFPWIEVNARFGVIPRKA